jgi:hypothetical protein
MSSNYAVLGLAMAAAGVATDVAGARTVWIAAGALYLGGALVAAAMTRWLPVRSEDEPAVFELSAESAVAALGVGNGNGGGHEPEADEDGARPTAIERIATLLEEIEARRAAEARRPS